MIGTENGYGKRTEVAEYRMTEKGMSIRLPAKEVSIIGRNAQGVPLVRQDSDDKLAAITPLAKEDDEDEKQEGLPLKK